MKLVSYNILDGGEGRADPLAEVIEAHHPDIVVIVEADDPAVIDRIATRLKMDVAFAHGRKHGCAILSHWEITESINHALVRPAMSDCFLEATISAPDGTNWTLAAIHLHAHATEVDESRREEEVDAILQTFATHRLRNQPHLLIGDFNANSPIQKIEINRCKLRTRKDWESNCGHLPRRAVTKLLDAGYLDSLHAEKPEIAETIGSFSTQFPGQRVDYIFTFGIDQARLSDTAVEQDRLARYASDHFPVVVRID